MLFNFRRVALALALLGAIGVTEDVSATTLERIGIDELASASEVVAVGRVEHVRSYWNETHTFILSDIELRASRSLKGRGEGELVRFTVPGGVVDDIGVLAADGPEHEPGREYAVFLGRGPVDEGREALTPIGFTQGVWDRTPGRGPARFSSQARRMQLLGDEEGRTDAAGGSEGLSIDELVQAIQSATPGVR
jgi:hypothetical protein